MSETRVVIVIPGEGGAETVQRLAEQLPEGASIVTTASGEASAEQLLIDAAVSSGALPERIAEWWSAASAGDGFGPVMCLALAAVVMIAIYAAELFLIAPVAARLMPRPADGAYSGRIRRAAWWAAGQAIRLGFFSVATWATLIVMRGSGPAMAALGGALLASVMRYRLLASIGDFLMAPGDATRRPTGVTDAEAGQVMWPFRWLLVAGSILSFTRQFAMQIVVGGESTALLAVMTRSIELVLIGGFFISVRKPFARLIASAFAPDSVPTSLAARAARNWHVFYSGLAMLVLMTEAQKFLVPGATTTASSRGSMAIFVLAPFVIAGLRIWRESMLAGAGETRRGFTVGIFALAEGLTIVLTAVLVLVAWQVDPFATDGEGARRIVPRLVTAGLILAAGISIWRAARAFLDAWAPEAPGAISPTADGDDGGPGGSRMATVYPIIRATASVFVVAMTVLLALAALGFNILPLIAGAGIVGLAIGFGSQTLVKDIISGMFYLWEDAFRVGEFVVTDKGKGVVEKILLRSVRLRHPRGQIYTIPFGSMGTIQNHSRDWVKVKFSFDVPQDEDIERVRKLIKKVGIELMDDPELAGKFIDPLKSQGAVAMTGANYQIGVKFTCPPGQQFVIRRKAYAALQKAFTAAGIHLATPRVQVDSIGDVAGAAAAHTSSVQAAEPR